MIKEWHDDATASALESAGRESAACCFAPWGEKGSGSLWQRKWNQTNAESLHMSVQMMLILLAFMGWRWGVHRVWGSCFACNEGVCCRCLDCAPRSTGTAQHIGWDTVRWHSFCPSSPVLVLFTVQTCFRLPHFFSLCKFIPCLCSWLSLC